MSDPRTQYDEYIDAWGLAKEFYRQYGETAEAQMPTVKQYADALLGYYQVAEGVPNDIRARCLREALNEVINEGWTVDDALKIHDLAVSVYGYLCPTP